MSIIGHQIGETLHPYITSNGNELLIVHIGKRTVEEMFSSEHAQNRFLTWALRLAGWFLMFIGLTCVSNIVQSLGEFDESGFEKIPCHNELKYLSQLRLFLNF